MKQEAAAGGAPARQGRERGALATFVASDHRYVFLGTSVVALIGMRLSMAPRSTWSFLAGVYSLEVVMYYALAAFVAWALLALVNKLVRWRDYATTSPFARPAAKRVERVCSYVVCAITAVLFVVAAVLGLIGKSALGRANPKPERAIAEAERTIAALKG